jgi:hypothetical protein
MVVRIRFVKPPSPLEKRLRNRRLALAFAALLQPPAVAALALAMWSIAAGMQWVGSFAFARGLLSHWQTWVAAAAAIWSCARALNHYGSSGGETAV